MSTSQGEAASADEHAAPPEAWDAIAQGYDRYVAPQEVDLANEALRLVELEPGERFLVLYPFVRRAARADPGRTLRRLLSRAIVSRRGARGRTPLPWADLP